jgi:hypothetical protein
VPRLLPRLKGRANEPLASPVGANPTLPGGETSDSQKATAGKRSAKELDSSDSGG